MSVRHPLRPTMRVAFHEAGHAVSAAILFPSEYRFSHVFIRSAEQLTRAAATTKPGEASSLGAVVGPWPFNPEHPITLIPSRLRTSRRRAQRDAYDRMRITVISAMAGPVAEARFTKRKLLDHWVTGGIEDGNFCAESIARFRKEHSEQVELWAELEGAAKRLVSTHWKPIARTANLLFERQRLSYAAVSRAIVG